MHAYMDLCIALTVVHKVLIGMAQSSLHTVSLVPDSYMRMEYRLAL